MIRSDTLVRCKLRHMGCLPLWILHVSVVFSLCSVTDQESYGQAQSFQFLVAMFHRFLQRRALSLTSPCAVRWDGSMRNAVRTEVATLDVYTPHAETRASAQRRAIRDLRREGVSRTAPTSIDQLTNISTDPGSRSMIRSRSDPSLAFAGKGGIVSTDAGEFSVLARIDCTCWMDAKGGPHTQSLPVT